MGVADHTIEISPTGFKSLRAVTDKKVRREIGKVIDGPAKQPESQGKALMGALEGLRSVRAARNRYRVIYSIDSAQKMGSVLVVGMRKAGKDEDVYQVARKLLKTLLGEERK